jgi:hydrogenase maturation factor
MNLYYGEIIEVVREEGFWMGKTRVGGAFRIAALDLIHEPARGDRVLLCDGVAVGKVQPETTESPCVSPSPES